MLQDVDVSPTPDSRRWSVLLLVPVVRIADRAAVDMGQHGMNGEVSMMVPAAK